MLGGQSAFVFRFCLRVCMSAGSRAGRRAAQGTIKDVRKRRDYNRLCWNQLLPSEDLTGTFPVRGEERGGWRVG